MSCSGILSGGYIEKNNGSRWSLFHNRARALCSSHSPPHYSSSSTPRMARKVIYPEYGKGPSRLIPRSTHLGTHLYDGHFQQNFPYFFPPDPAASFLLSWHVGLFLRRAAAHLFFFRAYSISTKLVKNKYGKRAFFSILPLESPWHNLRNMGST